MSIFMGVLFSVAAGLAAGFCSSPIKLMRQYQYEHWLLISSFFSLIVLPWGLAFWLCPGLFHVLTTLPLSIYIKANLWSMAWGIANILCCLCLVRIGFSLTFGILTGVGLPVGILVPMIFKGSGQFSHAPSLFSSVGALILLLTIILIFAVVLIAWAGFEREKTSSAAHQSGTFKTGLMMTILAGIFQVGLSFAFVYSQGPITQSLRNSGASEAGAIASVWAATLPGGAILNILYPLILIFKNRNGQKLWYGRDFMLCIVRAVLFMCLILCLGIGMKYLGVLGASLGFGIYQGLQVLASQSVGVISGEWHGAALKPKLAMASAVFLILAGVIGMSIVKE